MERCVELSSVARARSRRARRGQRRRLCRLDSGGPRWIGSSRSARRCPRRSQAWQQTASPVDVADALDALTNQFIGLYDNLSESQLDAICFHRRGNRSVRWYAAHRLAEVAFHGWDVRTSLGHGPDLDDRVAMLLLPTLLESNAPRTYAAGLSAERGSGERFRLTALSESSTAWLVSVYPDRLEANRGDAEPADVTIAGTPGALALLVYGRLDLHSAALRVEGVRHCRALRRYLSTAVVPTEADVDGP